MTFLAELRQATSDLHRRLDAGLDLVARPTRERYAAYLRGTLLVVAPLEDALGPALGEARRTPLLRADLAALGESPEVGVPAVLPALRDPGARLGSAYVVEGSALGGLVLARALEPRLALAPSRGTSFLRLRGEDTATHWRSFLGRLEAFGARAAAPTRRTLVATAVATFGAYEAAFRRTGALAA